MTSNLAELIPLIWLISSLLLSSNNGVRLRQSSLTLYRMVMPIGTPFLKEKINN